MIEIIEVYGINLASKMLAEYVNQKIPSEYIAKQFILEELEAASQGNGAAKHFAHSSGFDKDDYFGAMHNSFEEVDGADGPQQEILNLCMMLYPNQSLMTELRIKTVDNIMRYWELGKYAAVDENLRLMNVVKRVNDLSEEKKRLEIEKQAIMSPSGKDLVVNTKTSKSSSYDDSEDDFWNSEF